MSAELLNRLSSQGLIHPPKWLSENTHYMTMMGSIAYGTSQDDSDVDVYGFAMPPLGMIFPHTVGEIPDFGTQKQRFNQWQEHHVKTNHKEYDFTIYGIVRYVHLCMDSNPNMIDSIFTPQRCVMLCTQIGQRIRDNRKLFLSKKVMPKFRGYAYSQKSKIENKVNYGNVKRAKDIEAFGYSTKYAAHLIRLVLECEQILSTGDLDITQCREILKSIRRGEWKLEKVVAFFEEKEKQLEELYVKSDLPWAPDEDAIRTLLLECIEMHYGKISHSLATETKVEQVLNEMQSLIDKYQK